MNEKTVHYCFVGAREGETLETLEDLYAFFADLFGFSGKLKEGKGIGSFLMLSHEFLRFLFGCPKILFVFLKMLIHCL
jgi:hypothetical protein